MDPLNNPAGRLFQLLKQARKGQDNDKGIAVWETVLGVSSDRALLLERFAGVLRLPGQIREGVEHLDDEDQQRLAVNELDKIESALSATLNQNRVWLRGQVTDTAMQSLEWTGTLLGRLRPEPTIIEAARDAIRRGTEELLASAAGADLPSDLRSVIAGHLRAILLALDEYPVSGMVPLVRASHAALGDLIIRDPGDHMNEPWAKRAAGVILTVVLWAGNLSNALELPQNIRGVLPTSAPTVQIDSPADRADAADPEAPPPELGPALEEE